MRNSKKESLREEEEEEEERERERFNLSAFPFLPKPYTKPQLSPQTWRSLEHLSVVAIRASGQQRRTHAIGAIACGECKTQKKLHCMTAGRVSY